MAVKKSAPQNERYVSDTTTNAYIANASRIMQTVLLDVIVCLFVGLLIFEKSNRWPVLFVVVPLLLFYNIKQIQRMRESSRRVSIALPFVYGTGLAYVVLWTTFSFEWWKLLIVPIPLFFMIHRIWRAKYAERPTSRI